MPCEPTPATGLPSNHLRASASATSMPCEPAPATGLPSNHLRASASATSMLCEPPSFASEGTRYLSLKASLLRECNQPNTELIQKMVTPSGRSFGFVSSWYSKFPWITYCAEKQKVLCMICHKFQNLHPEKQYTKFAFTKDGFGNWKDGAKLLKGHNDSTYHKDAVATLFNSTQSVSTLLSSAAAKSQSEAEEALVKIITNVMYLGRQGLALRGHEGHDGNFVELLKLRSEDTEDLKRWLHRTYSYTGAEVQNELLLLISHRVLRQIVSELTSKGPTPFTIIVDDTQDVSGIEQQSICLRYTRENLEVVEQFVVFYEPSSTTGQALASMMEDALLRLGLSISEMRGLAFDGAANMCGIFKGAQSIMRTKQPCALFVHCGAHCLNLVLKDTCESSELIRNSLYTVNQLGVLLSESITMREKFFSICLTDGAISPKKLRPLCPTRWNIRLKAVVSILDQYPQILRALEELEATGGYVAVRAQGLRCALSRGSTYVALGLARSVLQLLHRATTSAQQSTCTVSKLMQTVAGVKECVQALRDNADDCIKGLLKESYSLTLESPEPPRQRILPARLAGPADHFTPSSSEEWLRVEYLSFLDATYVQLSERFEGEGIKEAEKYEILLLNVPTKESTQLILSSMTNLPPEIEVDSLTCELQVFHKAREFQSLDEAVEVFKELGDACRSLLPNVERLIRLLLILPSSTATA